MKKPFKVFFYIKKHQLKNIIHATVTYETKFKTCLYLYIKTYIIYFKSISKRIDCVQKAHLRRTTESQKPFSGTALAKCIDAVNFRRQDKVS